MQKIAIHVALHQIMPFKQGNTHKTTIPTTKKQEEHKTLA